MSLPPAPDNLSRNHHVGFEVAKGRKVEEVLESMENVAEGVDTTAAVNLLSKKYRVHTLPYSILLIRCCSIPMPPEAIGAFYSKTP